MEIMSNMQTMPVTSKMAPIYKLGIALEYKYEFNMKYFLWKRNKNK